MCVYLFLAVLGLCCYVQDFSSCRKQKLDFSSCRGFPCGSAVKESACNAGDLGSIPRSNLPWPGRSPGEGKGYPVQYSGLENSMGCIVHGGRKESTGLSNLHFQIAGATLPYRQSFLGSGFS